MGNITALFSGIDFQNSVSKANISVFSSLFNKSSKLSIFILLTAWPFECTIVVPALTYVQCQIPTNLEINQHNNTLIVNSANNSLNFTIEGHSIAFLNSKGFKP